LFDEHRILFYVGQTPLIELETHRDEATRSYTTTAKKSALWLSCPKAFMNLSGRGSVSGFLSDLITTSEFFYLVVNNAVDNSGERFLLLLEVSSQMASVVI